MTGRAEMPIDPVEVAPGVVRFTACPLEILVAMGLLNATVLEDDEVEIEPEVADVV